MFKFTPNRTEFFGFFEQAAELTVQAARIFNDLMGNFEAVRERAEEIHALEHQVDDIVHRTMALLHHSFITPLDRGDIRQLIHGLDNIIDSINAAVSRIHLYQIDSVLDEAKPLAGVLVEATVAVQTAVSQLRNLRKSNDIVSNCIRINQLENQGDEVYRKGLVNLFKSGIEPLDVIKWKEILEYIEGATDCCEEVADIVEGIYMENA
jgi:uncharacterized protein